MTSTALVVIGMQWLLRVRLWERNTKKFNTTNASEDWAWKDQSPCAGLQLVALLCLLQSGLSAPSAETASPLICEIFGNADGDTPLAEAFGTVVGLSPVLIAALAGQDTKGGVQSDISQCAVFRACMSVFDSSAVMYQPQLKHSTQGSKSSSIMKGMSFLCQVRNAIENCGRDGDFISEVVVQIPDLQWIALEIITYISHRITSTSSNTATTAIDASTSPLPVRSQASGILLGVLFDMTVYTCMESSSPEVRVYGLQTLESWLGRVDAEKLTLAATQETQLSAQSGGKGVEGQSLRENLLACLVSVSGMLTRAWSHPSKIVSHMVPAVYQRVIDVVSSLDTTMKSRDAVGVPDHCDIWGDFLRHALAQPVEHRGRYQALSVLLPKIGGERLVQLNPYVSRDLVLGLTLHRTVIRCAQGE